MQWLIMREELEVLEVIGRGSYGKVMRGMFRNSEVAIKIILMRDADNVTKAPDIVERRRSRTLSMASRGSTSTPTRSEPGDRVLAVPDADSSKRRPIGSTPPAGSAGEQSRRGVETDGSEVMDVTNSDEEDASGRDVAIHDAASTLRSLRRNDPMSPAGDASDGGSILRKRFPMLRKSRDSKISARDKETLEAFWLEVRLLVNLRHPNLLLVSFAPFICGDE